MSAWGRRSRWPAPRSTGPRRSRRRSRGSCSSPGSSSQRADQQVEQPGADDRALGPGFDDAGDVLDEVDGRQQLVALAVGLHQRVLDAVVDHLREMARADRPGVHEARAALCWPDSSVARRLERVEDRLHLGDVLLRAADHQRVAVLQAPHAAGDAGVDVADALLAAQHVVHLVVGVLGVAPVDDHIARVEQAGQLLDRLPGRLPDGTITQMTRGAWRPGPAPRGCRRRACPACGRSPTTSWPARRTRSAMLPPILPSPISPGSALSSRLCAACSGSASMVVPAAGVRVVGGRGGRVGSAGEAHRHDQVAVAARALGRLGGLCRSAG